MSHEKLDREITDEDLSALVDGEIGAQREARARAEISEDAALAERLQAFEQVDELLRGLPERQVSEQLEARVLARAASDSKRLQSGWRRVVPRRRTRWAIAAPAAAALAAGLALTLTSGSTFLTDQLPGAGQEIAQQQPSAPLGDDTSALSLELAALEGEELEIALDFDTLADFELIDQLEMLERLAALDAEQG